MGSFASRFPRLDEYLRKLPNGVASYPDAQIKASLYRAALDTRPLDDVAHELPPPVADLILTPRLMSSWTPSVPALCVFLAIFDRYEFDEARFRIWSEHAQTALFGSALYRALLSVLSPNRLLAGVEKRWGTFHRGTDIAMRETSASSVEVTLTHPPDLYARPNLLGIAGGLVAAGKLSRAKAVNARLALMTSTEARFDIDWHVARQDRDATTT